MNTRTFLTIATIANLGYGLWYFLAPQGADYFDTVVNALFGFGAIAIIVRDRKASAANGPA